MSEHKATQQIARLVRARYPIIAVQSHEENRVQDHILEIAKAQGKTLYTWTISQGIQQVQPEPDEQLDGQKTMDPVAALRQILANGEPTEDEPAGPPALYLFKDLHPVLAGEHADPVVVRALRDVASALINRHQTLILLSPTFQAPTDAEKDIAIVDFPLPTAEELGQTVQQFIDNLPDGIDCELNGGREKVIRALQGLTAVEADAVLAQAVIAVMVKNSHPSVERSIRRMRRWRC